MKGVDNSIDETNKTTMAIMESATSTECKNAHEETGWLANQPQVANKTDKHEKEDDESGWGIRLELDEEPLDILGNSAYIFF